MKNLLKLCAIAIAAAASTSFAQPWEVTIDPRINCGDPDAPGTILNLAPGTYDLRPIDGAINVWNAVVDCDANGGNCDAGWMSLFSVRVGTENYMSFPEGCCPRSDRWASPALSLAHTRTSRLVLPGPGIAAVKFFLVDFPCSDNGGLLTVEVGPSCLADFNRDGIADFFDYLDFVDAFSNLGANSDFNHDEVVDFFDYLDFVDVFSVGC